MGVVLHVLHSLLSRFCLVQVNFLCLALWPLFFFLRKHNFENTKHFRLYYTKLRNNCAAVTRRVISYLTEVRDIIRCIHQRHAHLMSNLMKRETSWNHTHPKIKDKEKLSCLHTQVLLDRSSSSLSVFQYDPSHPQR